MLLDEALRNKIHDIRLRDRLLAEGKLTKEELKKLIKDLPDDSDNLEMVKTGQD